MIYRGRCVCNRLTSNLGADSQVFKTVLTCVLSS